MFCELILNARQKTWIEVGTTPEEMVQIEDLRLDKVHTSILGSPGKDWSTKSLDKDDTRTTMPYSLGKTFL